MNCDRCEFNPGCSIRKAHEDGTANVSCDVDLWLQERVRTNERKLKRECSNAEKVVCPMCGETFPTEDELILVNVDGISMGVCAECATEIELR